MRVRTGEADRSVAVKAVAIALAGAIGGGAVVGTLEGCGGGDQPEKPSTPKVAKPFDIKDHESLPAEPIQLSPATMTLQGCYKHFWSDKPGQRAPLPPTGTSTDSFMVTVDGRCNTPLSSHEVGMYPTPTQGGEPADVLTNGQVIGVVCKTGGQWIQDVRGSVDGSDEWIKAVTHDGTVGFVPDVNAGFPDTAGVPEC